MKKPKKPEAPRRPGVAGPLLSVMCACNIDKNAGLDFLENYIACEKSRLSQELQEERFEEVQLISKRLSHLVKHVTRLKTYEALLQEHPQKMRQYNINLRVWQAWDLKRQEDGLANKIKKLEEQASKLKQNLASVQNKIKAMVEEEENEKTS